MRLRSIKEMKANDTFRPWSNNDELEQSKNNTGEMQFSGKLLLSRISQKS